MKRENNKCLEDCTMGETKQTSTRKNLILTEEGNHVFSPIVWGNESQAWSPLDLFPGSLPVGRNTDKASEPFIR